MQSWLTKNSSGVEFDQELAMEIDRLEEFVALQSDPRSAQGTSYALALGSFSTLIYALIYWRLDLMLGVRINLFSAAIFLFCAVTIQSKIYKYVRHLAMCTVNAQILCLVTLVLGADPGAQYFLIGIAAVTVPFFRDIDRKSMWSWIMVSLIMLVMIEAHLIDTITCPLKSTLHLVLFRSSCVVATSLAIVLIFRQHLGDLDAVRALAQREHERSEALLLNILPETIAHRLKAGERVSDAFDDVTVLFADIVAFTPLAANTPPTQLLQLLNEIFSGFDDHAQNHGLEKIKTIGDAYMVAGGLPSPLEGHQVKMTYMALDMMAWMGEVSARHNLEIGLRIGIHTGPVVAGVVGSKKFIYDLWGDTVNLASRMESHGASQRIQISEAMVPWLERDFILEERGYITLKGRGEMKAYWVLGERPSTT